MSIELKIKSKHLSQEAKIIKQEERKLKAQAGWVRYKQGWAFAHTTERKLNSIHNHRVIDVRNENRATFLARAYLRGIPYSVLEARHNKSRTANMNPKLFDHLRRRVHSMVNKYGTTYVELDDVIHWMAD